MSEPRFITYEDSDDVEVEYADEPTGIEGYDVAEVCVYSLSGERLRLEVVGGKEWGPVRFHPTGEFSLDVLEGRVREHVQRLGLQVADTGDFLIDAANAILDSEWQSRWPKRPRWLDHWLRGPQPPPRFSRS